MKLPLSRIAELVSGSTTGATPAGSVATGYSIDSRTIRPGELFFAVKGEKMDGHDFVQHALENGAVAAVVSREKQARFASSLPLIAVEDTLVALQTLATAVRRLWGKPLIAVTGSAGKTSHRACACNAAARA
jgi:UDP-N-acetylmuramoyl-tripeptide--D-alanyl-D-alanine ligase